MNKGLLNKAVEEIDQELRRVYREEPINDLRSGVPLWTETVLDKVMTYDAFGDDVDELAEEVEELRREQQVCLLSMTIQAMHDDTVTLSAWTLPSGVTAYLVESWNGVPELFAIDEGGFSDEHAAGYLSTYIRSAYIGHDPEPDGPEELQISPLDVELGIETLTPELEMLIAAGNA